MYSTYYLRRSVLIGTVALYCCLSSGCGSSSSDSFPTGSLGTGTISSPVGVTAGETSVVSTSTGSVRVANLLEVPSQTKSFRAFGFSDDGAQHFGPVLEPKSDVVLFDGVPVGVTQFLVEFMDENDKIVGLAQGRIALGQGAVVAFTAESYLNTPAAVNALRFGRTSLALNAGQSNRLAIHATMDDGTTQNLSSAVSLTTDDPNVAAVDGDTVTALNPGTATITARLGSISVSLPVVVSNAALAGLSSSAPDPVLASGTEATLSVDAVFSDGSVRALVNGTDLSFSVAQGAGVVSVDADGTISALGVGSAVITVSSQLDSSFSLDIPVTVTAAVLSDLRIEGLGGQTIEGNSPSLRVVGVLSDGAEQDLTSQADLALSNNNPSDPASSGQVAVLAQNRIVTNEPGSIDVTVTVEGESETATLTVVASQITDLNLTPQSSVIGSLGVGGVIEFDLVATLDNGQTQILTSSALIDQIDIVAGGGLPSANITASFDDNDGELEVTAIAAGTSTLSVTVGGVSTPPLSITVLPSLPSLEVNAGLSILSPQDFDGNGVLTVSELTVDGTGSLTVQGAATDDFRIVVLGDMVLDTDILVDGVGSLEIVVLGDVNVGSAGRLQSLGSDLTLRALGVLSLQGDINTTSTDGPGNLSLLAEGDIALSGVSINASAQGPLSGAGADVEIRTDGNLALLSNATIEATGFAANGNAGDGGSVVVEASSYTNPSSFSIDVSGQGTNLLVGAGGSVTFEGSGLVQGDGSSQVCALPGFLGIAVGITPGSVSPLVIPGVSIKITL